MNEDERLIEWAKIYQVLFGDAVNNDYRKEGE